MPTTWLHNPLVWLWFGLAGLAAALLLLLAWAIVRVAADGDQAVARHLAEHQPDNVVRLPPRPAVQQHRHVHLVADRTRR
jgi:hypothetical protein